MSKSENPNGDPNEPNVSFASAVCKTLWAEHNLAELEMVIDHLLNEYRQTGGARLNPNDGKNVIGNLDVPPMIACLAGDIVFSLRSALDCCWMGLMRAINSNAGKQTLPRGDAQNVKASVLQASVERSFPGIERFLLNDLRAYEGGNETLWFVAQVDNWNKHNMLVLVTQETIFRNATFAAPGIQANFNNVKIVGFPQGAISFGGAPMKLQDNANMTLDVILQSRKPVDERHLMPFLRAALKETREGVELFARNFGKPVS